MLSQMTIFPFILRLKIILNNQMLSILLFTLIENKLTLNWWKKIELLMSYADLEVVYGE